MGNNLKAQLKFYLISFFAILLISFVILSPSFNLAFQDDDWRGVVLPRMDYAEGRLFTPYGVQLKFTGFLYSIFESNFYLHYILSFILRNLAAFSVLVFLYLFTKHRWASFFGGLMASIGLSGLQTTYEPGSINVYIAATGCLIFISLFYLKRNKFSLKYLIAMSVILLLSTVMSPVRLFPFYAWIVIVDILILLSHKNKVQFKIFLSRQLFVSAIFFLLYFLGFFGWFSLDADQGNKINNFEKFLTESTDYLSGLNFTILLNSLKGLGNIIVPSFLDKTGTISLLSGIGYILILGADLILTVKKRTEKSLWLFAFLLWPFIFFSCYFIIFLGGYDVSARNTIILESTKRYLYPPLLGLSISLAIMISYLRRTKLKKIFLSLTILLILIHALATYMFLDKLVKQRDGPFMRNIWKQLKQQVPESSLDINHSNVFYFETDGSPRAIYSVNDGFIGHMIAVYKIDNHSTRFTPTEITAFGKIIAPPIITYEELVSYIKKSMSENPESDIWNRIFAFRIEGEKLINIKSSVRKRWEADSK